MRLCSGEGWIVISVRQLNSHTFVLPNFAEVKPVGFIDVGPQAIFFVSWQAAFDPENMLTVDPYVVTLLHTTIVQSILPLLHSDSVKS